jgi:hypothetical protein
MVFSFDWMIVTTALAFMSMYLINYSTLGGSMRINHFAAYTVLALSLSLLSPIFAQAPAKAAAKSITVYKTPT